MKVRVNLKTNKTYGFSTHSFAFPVPLPYAIVPAVEEIVQHDWSAGRSKHAFTKKVFHKGTPIVQDGHDAGPMIADKAMGLTPWANARKANLELGSCRKVAFAASTVKMDGTATAGVSDDLPLMTCGEPAALPTAWPLDAGTNSVHVGLTSDDVLFGWIGVGVSIYFDTMFFVAGLIAAGAGEAPKMAEELINAMGWDPKKAAVGMMTGLAMSGARSYRSGWKEPISLKLELGIPGISRSFEVAVTPADGSFKASTESKLGDSKLNAAVERNAEGEWDGKFEQDLFDLGDHAGNEKP